MGQRNIKYQNIDNLDVSEDKHYKNEQDEDIPLSRHSNLPLLRLEQLEDDKNKHASGLITSRPSLHLDVVFLRLKNQTIKNYINQKNLKYNKISMLKTILLVPQIVVPKNTPKQTYIDFKIVGSKSLSKALDLSEDKDYLLKMSLVDYENPYSIDLKFDLYPKENPSTIIHHKGEKNNNVLPNFILKGNHKSGHKINEETVHKGEVKEDEEKEDDVLEQNFDNNFFNLTSIYSPFDDNEFNRKGLYEDILKYFGLTTETHLFGKYFKQIDFEIQKINDEIKKEEKHLINSSSSSDLEYITQKALTHREKPIKEEKEDDGIDIKKLGMEEFLVYFANYYVVSSKDLIYQIAKDKVLPDLQEGPKKQNEEYIKKIKNEKDLVLISKVILQKSLDYINEERQKIRHLNFIPDQIVYLNEIHSHDYLKQEIIKKSTKFLQSQHPKFKFTHSVDNVITCTFYIEYIRTRLPVYAKDFVNPLTTMSSSSLSQPFSSRLRGKKNVKGIDFMNSVVDNLDLTSRKSDTNFNEGIDEDVDGEKEELDYDNLIL